MSTTDATTPTEESLRNERNKELWYELLWMRQFCGLLCDAAKAYERLRGVQEELDAATDDDAVIDCETRVRLAQQSLDAAMGNLSMAAEWTDDDPHPWEVNLVNLDD